MHSTPIPREDRSTWVPPLQCPRFWKLTTVHSCLIPMIPTVASTMARLVTCLAKHLMNNGGDAIVLTLQYLRTLTATVVRKGLVAGCFQGGILSYTFFHNFNHYLGHFVWFAFFFLAWHRDRIQLGFCNSLYWTMYLCAPLVQMCSSSMYLRHALSNNVWWFWLCIVLAMDQTYNLPWVWLIADYALTMNDGERSANWNVWYSCRDVLNNFRQYVG